MVILKWLQTYTPKNNNDVSQSAKVLSANRAGSTWSKDQEVDQKCDG